MHSGDDSDGMSGVVAKVTAVGRKWYRCKCKFGKSRPISLIIFFQTDEGGMR